VFVFSKIEAAEHNAFLLEAGKLAEQMFLEDTANCSNKI